MEVIAGVSLGLASTNCIINNSSKISCWWWRLFGCGSYQILINKNIPTEYIENLYKYFHRFTEVYKVKNTQQICRKSLNGSIIKYIIPIRYFYIMDNEKNWIYVKPLINHTQEIVGWEFWSYCYFHANYKQYQSMIQFLDYIQTGKHYNNEQLDHTELDCLKSKMV